MLKRIETCAFLKVNGGFRFDPKLESKYFYMEPNLNVDYILDLFLNQPVECALYRAKQLNRQAFKHKCIDHTGIVFKVCDTLYFSMDLSNEIGFIMHIENAKENLKELLFKGNLFKGNSSTHREQTFKENFIALLDKLESNNPWMYGHLKAFLETKRLDFS